MLMSKQLFFILLAFSSFNFSCQKTDSNKDIYLLIGQSNMAGRAEIREQDMDSLDGVFLFTGDSIKLWEPAANPLNKYSSIRKKISMQKLGPGYSFAKTIREYFPEHSIGLLVNARGGTSIREWLPGTQYYDDAVERSKIAMKSGELKGILWHQGSSDTKRTDEYPEELKLLINSLRKDFDDPNLPFIVSELSQDKTHKLKFNLMLSFLNEEVEFTAIVSSDKLKTMDGTHFDSESQYILGERYASEMIKFLQK